MLTITDFGGVWLENRYPGVACDVPAPCFAFLFEDNPKWSQYYASGQEIHEYIVRVAEKYHVRQYVKFNHVVKHAEWNEAKGKWSIRIEDTPGKKVSVYHSMNILSYMDKLTPTKVIEDEADILLLAWGQLNNWAFPNVPGLHDFKGPYMHSADYDESFDPTGKNVALVGGGSTGVQILPHLQKVANRVDQYMRSMYVHDFI